MHDKSGLKNFLKSCNLGSWNPFDALTIKEALRRNQKPKKPPQTPKKPH